MKTIVLYESKRGSTEAYAKDIAKAIDCEVLPLKKFKWKTVKDYDAIVFGGWTRGSVIVGIDNFLSHWEEMKEKNVIVFSSGLSPSSKVVRDAMISSNLLDMYHLRYYQLQGKFDYASLSFLDKTLIKTSVARLQNDPNYDDMHKAAMQRLLTTPIDVYDQEGVNKIIRVLNKISLEVASA
ncbi:MAG: flavodoxin domain-containing protein [Bacilli bacterium]|nr:flavodoxin domain-containing protein [Bacilli bacterium]